MSDLIKTGIAPIGKHYGWGRNHLAVVDHTYGPRGERKFVRTLCGLQGRAQTAAIGTLCKRCERAQERGT